MANQNPDLTDVETHMKRANESINYLVKSGYANAVTELISNINSNAQHGTATLDRSLDRSVQDEYFNTGSTAYLNGELFNNYQQLPTLMQAMWKAGWMHRAAEAAILYKSTENFIENAEHLHNRVEDAQKLLSAISNVAISDAQRHKLLTVMEELTPVINSFYEFINPGSNDNSKTRLKPKTIEAKS